MNCYFKKIFLFNFKQYLWLKLKVSYLKFKARRYLRKCCFCSAVILRFILCSTLSLQPLGYIQAQDNKIKDTQAQGTQGKKITTLCISSDFNLRTGEFSNYDPLACDNNGNERGDGRKGNDGSGSGVSQGENNKNRDNWFNDKPRPIDEPLRDWHNRRDRETQTIIDEFQAWHNFFLQKQAEYLRQEVIPKVRSQVKQNIFNQFETQFFSKGVFNKQVRKQMEEQSQGLRTYIKELLRKKINLSDSDLDIGSNLIAEDIENQLFYKVYQFRLQTLTQQKMLKLAKLFIRPGGPSKNWIKRTEQIIKEVEPQLRTPLYREIKIGKLSYASSEATFIKNSQKIEETLYNTAYDLARIHILEPSEKTLNTQLESLNQTTSESVKFTKYTDFHQILSDSSPTALYERNISEAVKNHIQARYDRRDMEVLRDKGLGQPEEEPYEFKSPEGAFLEKNKTLYEKLSEANPYHEQGIRAREIGLSAVEVADEEFANGQKETAELAYSLGESMADIALGVLPYVGVAKDVYEAITGKHLLTGRSLTGVERSLSFVGIALSTISGGVLNSTSFRLALNKTDKVLSKVNQKLWNKYLKGVSDSELARLFKKYPKDIFKAIGEAGFKTRKGIYSALYFAKRAFAGSSSTPKDFTRMEEVANTLRFVRRAGVEDYKGAIDELAEAGVGLPKMGEEFLARQMRFQKEILGAGQKVTKADLVRMGRVYSAYYKGIDEVSLVVYKGKVWRGVRKTRPGQYTNSPDTIFDIRPNTRYIGSQRYSMPEEKAIYTSLSRKTAIAELKAGNKTKALTNKQVEESFYMGSKDIELNKVLDLTDPKTRGLFKVGGKALTEDDIATRTNNIVNNYETSQIIGHIAKRKGFKGIKAPSAPDDGGVNIVIFEGLK